MKVRGRYPTMRQLFHGNIERVSCKECFGDDDLNLLSAERGKIVTCCDLCLDNDEDRISLRSLLEKPATPIKCKECGHRENMNRLDGSRAPDYEFEAYVCTSCLDYEHEESED